VRLFMCGILLFPGGKGTGIGGERKRGGPTPVRPPFGVNG
jgi:hypothetical protein